MPVIAQGMIEFQGVLMTQREHNELCSGIETPRKRTLSPGTKLYRAADQNKSAGTGGDTVFDPAASAWWSGQKAFNKIMAYCVQMDEGDRGLGYAAREANAVLFEWGNDCNLLVEAYLKTSVTVFFGKGRAQKGNAPDLGSYEFKGWDDIEQWFIPGQTERVENGPGRYRIQLTASARSVIEVYRTCSIRSARESARSFR